MIEIIPYEPIHAYEIIERNVREQEIHLRDAPDWEETAKGWKDYGPAFTMVVDNQVVACAGVTILEPGMGEAWSLLSTLFYKHVKTAFKEMKERLDWIVKEYKLHTLRAFVKKDKGFEPSCHLLQHLGFTEDMVVFRRKC